MNLYPDQQESLAKLRTAYARKHKAVLFQASCGFGKSITAAEICRGALERDLDPLVVVPRLALVEQMRNTLDEQGLPAVRVETKQTMIRRPFKTRFLIDDEAHYYFSPAWQARLNEHLLSGGRLLGLTASPVPGMGSVYSEMVRGSSTAWLIANKRLSGYRAYGPKQPDLSTLPIHKRDFAPGPLGEFMERPSIIGDAIDSWNKFAPGKRTLGFAVSRNHSRRLAASFISAGIPAEHMDGDTPADVRRQIFARLAEGATKIIFNVMILGMGLDMSSQVGRDVPVEALLDEAPTKSEPNHIQKMGRPIRWKPYDAIYVDNANNIRDNGFPDDEYEFTLDAGSKRKAGVSGPAVSICGGCFAHFRTSSECPYCGRTRDLTPREVQQIEGELEELHRKEKRVEVAIARKGGIHDLVRIAKERGHAKGWVAVQLRIKKQVVDWGAIERAWAAS